MTRPSAARFAQFLVFLDTYADLRSDRAPEIMTQMGGALTFLSAIPFIHPSRTPWTLELLAAALRLANFTEMRFKHALASRRPNEYSPQVQPMILTPSHSSFPSGHATETFMSAYVVWRLLRASGLAPYTGANSQKWFDQLMRLASRVAINRTVAGVHFPVDSAAGCFLGLKLGEHFFLRCTAGAATTYRPFRFNGVAYPFGGAVPLDGDFYWEEIWRSLNGLPGAPYVIPDGALMPIQQNPLLNWLWRKAVGEWI